MSVRRPLSGVGALTLLASGLTFGVPAVAHAAGAGIDLGPVTVTKTVARVHLGADGSDAPVDSRTVTLKVAQTKGLHSRQPVVVSWTGARPTAAVVSDPNAAEARQQEYPMMLVECRGIDSPTAAAKDRLRPETCWTGSSRERVASDRSTGFGPWRLDRYETAARRKAMVDVPTPLPASCDVSNNKGERRTHFVSVRGIDYASDGDPCLPEPPESSVVGNASQPPNTTYAATQVNGTGSTKFTVWTSEDNASLGCAGGVPCSLVAIPIMGISCDVAAKALPPTDQPAPGKQADAASRQCRAEGAFAPGQQRIGGNPDVAVTGALWFSESNWRNRITVPLDFAPLNNLCDITGARAGVDVYGSELLAQLTGQWRPKFCLGGGGTPFKHVQVGEPQAANLLKAGNVDAAFLTDPPVDGYAKPTVMAPVSLTGFAITYAIDDENQDVYQKLRLTPRLLAKLLTQSYPGIQPVQSEYEALSRNPLDLSTDPEFIALNPGITKGVPASAAASTILNLSSDSDVVRAVTQYIAADMEAVDWLNGVPDPWGMVVNPNYSTNPNRKTGFTLPVNNWPLRDNFEPKHYYESGVDPCLQANPVPIMPLIAAPTARLANISLAIQFATASSQIVCQQVGDQGAAGAKLVALGRQSPGHRFVVGLTSLGDAKRYALDVAALQTHVASSAPDKFANGNGRTFVSPTDAALKAAAPLFSAEDASGTWRLSYDKVLNDQGSAAAYPGAMLVSLAASTTGMDAATAKGLSQLMVYAAGPGQVPGLDIGQLPPGYLPMTAANGLGAERAYTLKAAAAVAAQNGARLAPSGKVPDVGGSPGGGGGSAGDPPSPGTSGGGTTTPVLNADGSTPGSGGTALPPKVAPSGQQPVANVSSGLTGALTSALAGTAFPLLLVLAGVGAIAALVINRFGRPRAPTT